MLQFLHSKSVREGFLPFKTLLILVVFLFGNSFNAKAQDLTNALEFNGADTYVEANSVSTAISSSAALTLEAWIYPENVTGQRYILTFHRIGYENRLLFGIKDGVLVLGYLANTGSDMTEYGTTQIPLNIWTHISFSIDNSGNAIAYIDGQEEFTYSIPVWPDSDGRFSIGQDFDGATITDVFDGKIDEVRVWNTVRTQTDIQAYKDTELAGSENGLVAYYRMRDGSGIVLTDNSDNGRNGTLVGGVKWINNPPLAHGDPTTGSYQVYCGETISGNVLDNDTDVEGNEFDVDQTPILSQGSFTSFYLETGAFVYQAPMDYAGEVRFAYQATDGALSDTATVSINVKDTISPTLMVPLDIHLYADAGQCGTVLNFQGEIEDVVLSNSNLRYSENADLWQSFVPGVTGLLKKFQLKHDGNHDLSFTFDIYIGEGISGQLLYSQSCNLGEFGDGWFDIDIPTANALILTAGETYTFHISGSYGYILGNSSDLYSQGRMTYRSDWDLCFRTFVVKGVTASDNTGKVELEQTNGLSSGSVFPVGETINTFIATDASGNKVGKSFKVTVEDNIDPVVVTKNITIYLDSTGLATIDAEDINNGSSDNCGIDIMSLSETDFSCSDIGGLQDTLTVTDVNGNSSLGFATVTVLDTISPIAIGKDLTIYLGNDGTASISQEDMMPVNRYTTTVATYPRNWIAVLKSNLPGVSPADFDGWYFSIDNS